MIQNVFFSVSFYLIIWLQQRMKKNEIEFHKIFILITMRSPFRGLSSDRTLMQEFCTENLKIRM